MSLRDLQLWLINYDGFTVPFRRATIATVRLDLRLETEQASATVEDIPWDYLLTCASVLAASPSEQEQTAALRIATGVLLNEIAAENQRHAAALILDRLRNRPALSLAKGRGLLSENWRTQLPLPLRLDSARASIDSLITLVSGETIRANRFQRDVWSALQNNQCVSVSGPTSSGKSFLLKRWLESRLAHPKQPRNAVFIVPTRALIHEVEAELRAHFLARKQNNVIVTSMPNPELLDPKAHTVLVFTQERFHLFSTRIAPEYKAHILIVDEAQKVGDRSRGVLLQQMIDRTAAEGSLEYLVFASPFAANPEALISDAPDRFQSKAVASDQVTVVQNLIWVTQVRRNPRAWQLTFVEGEVEDAIGELRLPNDPAATSKRLPFVAHASTRGTGGNVIYANGAADAEKAAAQLYDLLGPSADRANAEVDDVIALAKRTVHPSYSLVRVLRRGVAFHYGNMPLTLRIGIEDLFKADKVQYLVCTSTLLEGVNLPCRNLFARGPTKGRGKPMSPEDFWNLAGRAGRWGKEFQGNIFCIDANKPNVWKRGAPRQKVKAQIGRASEELARSPAEVIAFINAGAPRAEAASHPEREQFASYAWTYWKKHNGLDGFGPASSMSADDLVALASAIEGSDRDADIPLELMERNPGISPSAMRALFDYFDKRGLSAAEYAPVPASSDDAVDGFLHILGRIDEHLSLNVFARAAGRRYHLALLIVDWMRGYPLNRIIASRENYYIRKKRSYRLPNLIRDVMSDVENIARFVAPKYIGCYTDVLRLYFERRSLTKEAEALDDVTLQLELGASTKTQIALMALGLSRTAAMEASELIADSELDRSSVIAWLRAQDWEYIDLPNLLKKEVENLLAVLTG